MNKKGLTSIMPGLKDLSPFACGCACICACVCVCACVCARVCLCECLSLFLISLSFLPLCWLHFLQWECWLRAAPDCCPWTFATRVARGLFPSIQVANPRQGFWHFLPWVSRPPLDQSQGPSGTRTVTRCTVVPSGWSGMSGVPRIENGMEFPQKN